MGQQREEVLTKLRQLITHGYYVPGQMFSENELIEKLGVSRSPIREALAVLAQEGIVDQLHRKGVMVRHIGEPETREVLQLRRSIEQMTVRQLATSADPKRLDGVDEVLAEMDRAAETQDAAAFLDADTEFHCGMARRAGYGAAADMLRTLRDKVRIIGLDSLQRDAGFASANDDHRELVRAIDDNDVDRALEVLRVHLDATSRLLIRELKSEAPPDVDEIRRLVEQARRYRRHEGRIRESIELLEQAAELAGQSDTLHHVLVQVLLELATTRRHLRDYPTAKQHALEALRVSVAHRNRAGQAWANSELGRIALDTNTGDQGRLDTASDLFKGLHGQEEERQRGWNRYNLALRAQSHNALLEAQSEAATALEILERVGDDYGRAQTLELLGRLAALQQDDTEARRLLGAARELATDKDLKPVLATTTLEEGRLLRRSAAAPGEVDQKLRTALSLFRSMEDGRGMSDALQELEEEGTPIA